MVKTNPVIESVVAFLGRVPPFQFLDESTLARVAAQAEVQFFPKGSRILEQGGPPAAYLYVIERGGVKKSIAADPAPGAVQPEEILLDVAGEGDLIGVLSSVEGDASRMTVVALQDTLCYAIPVTVVTSLLETFPAFTRGLLHISVEQYVERGLEELGRRPATAIGRPLHFTTPVRDLIRTPLLTGPGDATIRDVARWMTQARTTALVILDAAGQPTGIVTDSDIRARVVAGGRDPAGPVAEIMSRPVLTIGASEPVYEATRLMIGHGVHHLVVVEQDQPIAILSARDLIALEGASPLAIARQIDGQTSAAGLRQIQERAQQIVPALLGQGVRASQIARLMAEINDRIVAQTLALTESALGPPPAEYCWLALGSEGRREQTFKTDQDNAIIYADPHPARAGAIREYFLAFGERAVANLVEAGFPPCPGHYTADNPAWTLAASDWQDRFFRWLRRPEPDAVLHSLIFFDFRGIAGKLDLAATLRAEVGPLASRSSAFLVHLANISTSQSPPLGFLGQIVVERSGEHRDQLDLKQRGTGPITNLARFLALRHGISKTGTLGRLEALAAASAIPPDLASELSQAFEFMLGLRIRRQWDQIRDGQPATNFLNPKHLSALDRTLLRESFHVIARAQTVVREEFHADRVAS